VIELTQKDYGIMSALCICISDLKEEYRMELIKELELKLKTQWQQVSKAKMQHEVQELRAQALETYRLLKKQKVQVSK
jgi:hypothetical protein